MKTILAVTMCLGLAFATLNIPLKCEKVKATVDKVEKEVDTVLYADGSITHLGASSKDEKILLDVGSDANYVISRGTKYGTTPVSSSAFECTSLCETPNLTDTVSVLGGKGKLTGI